MLPLLSGILSLPPRLHTVVSRGSHTWTSQLILLGYPHLSELDFQVLPIEGRTHTTEALLRPHFYLAMCSFHLKPVLTGSVMADTAPRFGRI